MSNVKCCEKCFEELEVCKQWDCPCLTPQQEKSERQWYTSFSCLLS